MVADGCSIHVVSEDDITTRWAQVEKLINRTPEDDRDAQWSVILLCGCCCGPSKHPSLFCSRCEESQ